MYEKYPIYFMVARLRKKTFFSLHFPLHPSRVFLFFGSRYRAWQSWCRDFLWHIA